MSKGGCHGPCIHGRVSSLSPQRSLVGHAALVHGAVGMATVGGLWGEVAGGESELASGVACASAFGAGATAWAEGPCCERRVHGDSPACACTRASGDAS